MKRPKTGDKRKSVGSIPSNSYSNSSFDELRIYITELESLLKVTLLENSKLKSDKKLSAEIRKIQQKTDETIKKYSKGKLILDSIEKNMTNIKKKTSDKSFNNVINEDDSEIKFSESYEIKIEKLESELRNCKKEKEDLDNKYKNEFELMASVIYNLGFIYWSMKSDYEDKLKSNKGWLEMERIKQYNGDY